MSSSRPDDDTADRGLGVGSAIAIGLAAMLGAGVFSVWAPAAQAAGAWLLAGLAIAAFVAFANAGSTAQLAVRHPQAGGAYRYGRVRLGPWPGFLAGWSFVIGKTASCAAMAMTAAAYLVAEAWQRPVAALAVVAIVGIDLLGITRTARVASVIVAGVIAVLGIVVVAGASAGLSLRPLGTDEAFGAGTTATPYGILQSAALVFFAFAGYARIATLSEEVRHPTRTIPRAIAIAFGAVVLLYFAVGTATLAALGPEVLAGTRAPLVSVVHAAGWIWAEPVVRIAAGVAALGSLLALVAGLGRTSLAMARDRELPPALARVHPRRGVPWVAELAIGAAVVVLVLVADLREAIGFSAFGVLLYYLVANAAAITQPRAERLVPRWLSWAGAIGCLVLVVTLPLWSIAVGGAVLLVGVILRLVRTRAERGSGPPADVHGA